MTVMSKTNRNCTVQLTLLLTQQQQNIKSNSTQVT